MNILIIGSGGREHTLAWKIAQSPQTEKLYCIPGNGGMSQIAECVDIAIDDIEGLVKFAKEHDIGLTVVGPEAPLVNGIVDIFEKERLMVFGPRAGAAQLEGSKAFSKDFMHRCSIPTAVYKTFDDLDEAKTFLAQAQYPLVVKADGLAAGKGVIICKDSAESQKAVDEIMKDKVFHEAGNKVVIEECLDGEEASILAISDGDDFVVLDSSQDHKRIFDEDLGPNTGGMGAYSPAPVVDEELLKTIKSRVIEPTIRGMKREGNPFKGVLYAGIMVTKDGPKVLEFNVRFGDPETQAVLARLKSDLVEIMVAACESRINAVDLVWDTRSSICVVMSSGGYPSKYEKGFEITGIEDAQKDKDTIVFHAGTKRQGNKIVTSGGRVLGIVSLDDGIVKTIERVYEAVEKIKFEKCFFRRDIGAKALIRLDDLPSTPTHR